MSSQVTASTTTPNLKSSNGSATSIIPDTKYTSLASGLVQVEADARIVDSFSGHHTSESLSKLYDSFSADYEKAYAKVQYEGPLNVAKALKAALPNVDGNKVRVLDAGCGSGLVGEGCVSEGFTQLVGVDLSIGMLEEARSKVGLYQDLKTADLTKAIPFEDNEFDAIVSCGVFTAGHVPKESIRELIRTVRPGGVLCIACQEHVFNRENYSGFFELLKEEGLISGIKLTASYAMKRTNTAMTIVTITVC